MSLLFDHVATFTLTPELAEEINRDMASDGRHWVSNEHCIKQADFKLSEKIANYCVEEIQRIYGDIFAQTNQIIYSEHLKGGYDCTHWDQTYEIFDGDIRGVPILSIMGVTKLADEGGKFFITTPDGEKQEYLSKENTVVVFPSTFLYRHETSPVLMGSRKSFFTWGY
jgi:hypothetical protein